MAAGIYVHIPFCKQKCLYCDFVSGQGKDTDMELYQKALINEIELTDIKEPVDSVFFFFFSPSVYSVEYIEEILALIIKKYGIDSDNSEITIEVNPGTIDYDKLVRYKNIVINRLSIGLQSANNNELRTLGRIHSYEEFLKNYENARRAGFTNINIDLMSAIPYQTVESYMETLKKVINLKPEHISSYSLIIEEGTPFFDIYSEGMPFSEAIPDEETDRKMYCLTKEFLAKNGYNRYEISNYSKENHECMHNIKYWSRENYYGFGVAAASLVNNVRYTNTDSRKMYIDNAGNPQSIRRDIEYIGVNEQIEEYMFLGLRKMQGINTGQFEKVFGKRMEDVYGDIPDRLCRQGLCRYDNEYFYLTDYGVDISNTVFTEFMF